MPFAENDICYYKGRAVRLLFPATPPLNGWIAVWLLGEGGGRRRTGSRVHIDDESKLEIFELKPPVITEAGRQRREALRRGEKCK